MTDQVALASLNWVGVDLCCPLLNFPNRYRLSPSQALASLEGHPPFLQGYPPFLQGHPPF